MNADDGGPTLPANTRFSPEVCCPSGEFMTPLPLERVHVRSVPSSPGCYFIYVGDQPYYAGMSRTSMRKRIWAHATGRGSKMIQQMLADGHAMYFEYCAIDPAFPATGARDIARTEFAFMLLHTGKPLPGNLKLDGLSLFPDPTFPRADPAQGGAFVDPSYAPPNTACSRRRRVKL